MSQLDIFEILDEDVLPAGQTYEIGDFVKIKKIVEEDLERLGSEDYFYLKEFANKKGKIVDIKQNKMGVFCYQIVFERGIDGYFYESDLIHL